MILTVDAAHWLRPDGSLPDKPPALRRQALRVARIIEYGGQLERGTMRETLIECSRRSERRPCPGLLWVEKLEDDRLHAFCLACKDEQLFVSNWQNTQWADGVMEAIAVEPPELDEPQN